MSDGPHRSLPLRKHWKTLAERAATDAYPADQVGEALPYALKKEFLEAPLAAICEILIGDHQETLFCDDRIEKLEAVREACRGSAAGSILIDCAIDTVDSGMMGKAACIVVLKNALAGYAHGVLRSIEEHYLRKADSKDARFVRDRLGAAHQQCDFGDIAAEMLDSKKRPSAHKLLPRHASIDEGPPV